MHNSTDPPTSSSTSTSTSISTSVPKPKKFTYSVKRTVYREKKADKLKWLYSECTNEQEKLILKQQIQRSPKKGVGRGGNQPATYNNHESTIAPYLLLNQQQANKQQKLLNEINQTNETNKTKQQNQLIDNMIQLIKKKMSENEQHTNNEIDTSLDDSAMQLDSQTKTHNETVQCKIIQTKQIKYLSNEYQPYDNWTQMMMAR
jgi:hypothetical protein